MSTSEATGVRLDQLSRLHRLMTMYLSSKALFTALELGVFDRLAEQPATVEELGPRLGLARRPTQSLMLALLGEELVERTDGRYRNAEIASNFLVSSAPHYVGVFAAHQNGHFTRFARLTDSLREDKPLVAGQGYSAFGGGEDWARRLVQGANLSALLQAEPLAERVALDGHRHLVDLGCGGCAYSIALARRNPGLRITAVDQPQICEVAREYVSAAGLTDRISLRTADIFNDDFTECDVALVSHVLDGFAEPPARKLIEHVHDWLPEGGELLIHTHLPQRAEVPFPYMMGLILVVNNTQGGEVREEEQYRQFLLDAGFREASATTVSSISSVVRGRR